MHSLAISKVKAPSGHRLSQMTTTPRVASSNVESLSAFAGTTSNALRTAFKMASMTTLRVAGMYRSAEGCNSVLKGVQDGDQTVRRSERLSHLVGEVVV